MAFFKNLWTFLTETIFLKDERNYRNGLIRWGVRQYKLLFYTARGLDEHDTLVRSAALTFYTLMSIVPIAAPRCCHSNGTAPAPAKAPRRTTSPARSTRSNTAA